MRSRGQTLPPIVDDERAKFYHMYREEAEEYDREFIDKYDEDLNNTLIFVRFFHLICGGCAYSVYRQACFPP